MTGERVECARWLLAVSVAWTARASCKVGLVEITSGVRFACACLFWYCVCVCVCVCVCEVDVSNAWRVGLQSLFCLSLLFYLDTRRLSSTSTSECRSCIVRDNTQAMYHHHYRIVLHGINIQLTNHALVCWPHTPCPLHPIPALDVHDLTLSPARYCSDPSTSVDCHRCTRRWTVE